MSERSQPRAAGRHRLLSYRSSLCGTTWVLPTETTGLAACRSIRTSILAAAKGPVCGLARRQLPRASLAWDVPVPVAPVQCFWLASERPNGSWSPGAIRAVTTLRPAHAPCVGRSGPSGRSTWSSALLLARASIRGLASTKWAVRCAGRLVSPNPGSVARGTRPSTTMQGPARHLHAT